MKNTKTDRICYGLCLFKTQVTKQKQKNAPWLERIRTVVFPWDVLNCKKKKKKKKCKMTDITNLMFSILESAWDGSVEWSYFKNRDDFLLLT